MPQNTPVESSIIIPVYNQWDLTQNCLAALGKTLQGKACEVIIIDNASSDATPSLCPQLGKELLSERFHYYRSETNLNFGPASNRGAQKAQGRFLVFLNNDTVPLPGWYDALIEDFTTYPDIAATGPVLVYPEEGPLGRTVQHLGVALTPTLSVTHVYEGIPEQAPLVKKRRFFQVITAACMVIPRELFMKIGMFDEQYINGCEDIDLCARLANKGYRMTINPNATVVHHTSQTPGRFTHDQANFKYLSQKVHGMLQPDWHLHLEKDRLTVQLTPWLHLTAGYPPQQLEALRHTLEEATAVSLRNALIDFPLWQEGYEAFAQMLVQENQDTTLLATSYDKLFRDTQKHFASHLELFKNLALARHEQLPILFGSLCSPYEDYLQRAQRARLSLKRQRLDSLANLYGHWLANPQDFRDNHYLPLLYALYKEYTLAQKAEPVSYEHYTAGPYAQKSAISARFDSVYYIEQNPDVSASSMPPFMHYALKGKTKGALHRQPKPLA